MNFFKEEDSGNASYVNKLMEIITTGMSLFFICGIFYGIYIICDWLLN